MADNPRKLLYLSIHDKLSGLISSETIKYIGRWNNQIDNEEKERASILPSVLIQIDNMLEAGSRASNYDLQEGEVRVNCHIGINVKGKNGIETEDWDIFQAVYEKLQGECGISGDDYNFTPLERLDEIEDNDYSGYYHGKLIFTTYLKDCTKGTSRDYQTGTIDTLTKTINGVKEL